MSPKAYSLSFFSVFIKKWMLGNPAMHFLLRYTKLYQVSMTFNWVIVLTPVCVPGLSWEVWNEAHSFILSPSLSLKVSEGRQRALRSSRSLLGSLFFSSETGGILLNSVCVCGVGWEEPFGGCPPFVCIVWPCTQRATRQAGWLSQRSNWSTVAIINKVFVFERWFYFDSLQNHLSFYYHTV